MTTALHPPLSSKQAYIDALQFGVGVVTFTKKDATTRVMAATLSDQYIPFVDLQVSDKRKDTPPPVENPDVLKVFDIEAEAWRSFRIDSVISFELQSGGDE